MLEEPESGAPGARGAAAAMDCKDRPVKKLIQARLPFKRLTLTPKEKTEDGSDDTRSSPSAPVRSPGPDVDAPLDSLESNFHMGSDVDFRPKLVNGKGPLDNLLRNRVKSNIGQTMVVIDLTEESSDLPDDIGAHSKLNSAASSSAKSVSGVREEAEGERGLLKASPKDKPAFPEETLSDRSAEEEGAGSGGAGRSRDVQKGSPRSCPALTDGPRTRSEKAWDGWSEAGGILFRGKVPVVVLQDVLAAEPPAARAPAAAADQGMPSESEMPESGPEEDSVLSLSSLSSCSPTSSPEGRSASGKQHSGPGPFPTCTPVRRVTKKLVKDSAEKDKMRLQRTLAGSCGKFAPFEIKENMVLAPRCRTVFDQELSDQLDQLLLQQNGDFSFLKDLKGRRPLWSGPTVVSNRGADIFNSDVVIVESGKADGVPERKKFGRMKLLQFSENHRPAYWGTWNKTTTVIHPRDPWAQDRKLLDYEVDSDDEWEEEEPGESLSHSEGDDDDEVGDDEDEDDGFFVPHGYLSEDEGVTEECADPENHKVRQKLKAKEWDEFLAKGKRFRVLQPVRIGCVWAADGDVGADLKVLQQFAACLLETAPPEEEQTPKASRREKRDQHILAQLLPLLHGNVNGSKVIIREFQECCRQGLLSRDAGSPESSAASPPSPGSSRPQTPTAGEDTAVPSKARLKRIISENSVYEKRPDFRMCWYVHPHVLKSFDQEHLPVPCQWSYVTMVPSATREDSGSVPAAGSSQGTPTSLKRKSAGSMCITQFMKKRRHDGQVGAGDLDGFQADTEEEEEEDGDCVMMDISGVAEVQDPCETTAGAGGPVGTDTSESPAPSSSLGPS
uniref:Chromatin assembly factor 1 subunit A n=1 Tax=Rousettus aegyptiacus TaxID=9407 RepID=A0A7J8BQF4_ROUAE|nr:chromatin assembly factor 1 subunit A [Rousettus aegyptiacus]